MKIVRNFGFATLALLAVSCQCDCEKNTVPVNKDAHNDLLPKSVSIKYEHDLKIPEGSEILRTIDQSKFVDDLSASVLTGGVTAYDPSNVYVALSKERLQMLVGSYADTLIGIDEARMDTSLQVENVRADRSKISRILFDESWYFDELNFSMTKHVQAYSPVKVYYREEDTLQKDIIKKLLFWVKDSSGNPDDSQLQLLQKDVTYEFSFYTPTSHLWLENLSIGRFAEILIDNVIDGKAPAYDFFETGDPIDVKEARRRLGETVDYYFVPRENSDVMDTVEVKGEIYRDEIRSVIFVEDWYVNPSSMQIVKKVKKIAPVRQFVNIYDNGEEDEQKRIVYVLNLN